MNREPDRQRRQEPTRDAPNDHEVPPWVAAIVATSTIGDGQSFLGRKKAETRPLSSESGRQQSLRDLLRAALPTAEPRLHPKRGALIGRDRGDRVDRTIRAGNAAPYPHSCTCRTCRRHG